MATKTAKPHSTVENRIERYRVRFDKRSQAAKCAQIAGACRLVWNMLLADCERRYQLHRAFGAGLGMDTSVSFFTLGKRFTDLRSHRDGTWDRVFMGTPWGRRYRDLDCPG